MFKLELALEKASTLSEDLKVLQSGNKFLFNFMMLYITAFIIMRPFLHLRHLHQDERWKNLCYTIWENQQAGG